MAAMEDIVLQYTWPRIDAEVSKHRNHLLKAPFCVHPKTGRVCVPVDPAEIDEFDPVKVPTVGQLLKEVDEAMVVNNEDGGEGTQTFPGQPLSQRTITIPCTPFTHKLLSSEYRSTSLLTSYVFTDHFPPSPHFITKTDWEKTSLRPYVALLDAHNKALMEETRRRKRGDKNTDTSTSESS